MTILAGESTAGQILVTAAVVALVTLITGILEAYKTRSLAGAVLLMLLSFAINIVLGIGLMIAIGLFTANR